MYHTQFPDRRMPDHRIFQRLHRQLRETRSFHVIRHDAGQRIAVRCSSLEKSILNIVADKPDSSTRTVAHLVSASHQTICRVLTPLPFSASISFDSGRLCSLTASASNCLLKPHSAGDVSSTPHSTSGTRILEQPSAGRLQSFECFPVPQNDVP
ncbi:uncharacterized protein TNCV_2066641 [Trichonephila clavipes]|uniref:Uncharacterized protein n=1 Tax=Trichonephila clavipes TaxID=2585209 RepID=A0A8X6W2N9_TRICX|nr:uncharacterized protein TNCV_2066641 [Trichonephila clavipes]